MSPTPTLDIAIIGGGIVGVATALGLLHRGMKTVRIFERAPELHEIGAGIGFGPNAMEAMNCLDPRIPEIARRLGSACATDSFLFADGLRDGEDDDRVELMFKVELDLDGFVTLARVDFLRAMADLLPPGLVEYDKNLVSVTGPGDDGKVVLKFANGTSTTAALVIGCDGIHSQARKLVLGSDHPATHPHYSHKYCIRALVPMDKAVPSLGTVRALDRIIYVGPDAHSLTFPIASGRLLNLIMFVRDPLEWPHPRHTAKVSKSEVVKAFENFGPTVQKVKDLLPDDPAGLDQWALFDSVDHPVDTWVHPNGRVVLAGDAAHPMGPHLGAGAGTGMEDASVLCRLLETALKMLERYNPVSDVVVTNKIVRAALEIYQEARSERAKSIVRHSRRAGDCCQARDQNAGSDPEKIGFEMKRNLHVVWDWAPILAVERANEQYVNRVDAEMTARNGKVSER